MTDDELAAIVAAVRARAVDEVAVPPAQAMPRWRAAGRDYRSDVHTGDR